jgi:hypothetical protein
MVLLRTLRFLFGASCSYLPRGRRGRVNFRQKELLFPQKYGHPLNTNYIISLCKRLHSPRWNTPPHGVTATGTEGCY